MTIRYTEGVVENELLILKACQVDFDLMSFSGTGLK